MDLTTKFSIFATVMVFGTVAIVGAYSVSQQKIIADCATKGEIKYADTRIKCEVVREVAK